MHASRVIARILLPFAFVIAPLGAVAAAAPAAPAAQAPAAPAGDPPAVLVIGGRDITTLRASPSTRSPRERVEGAKRHLFEAYERNKVGQLAVKARAGAAQVLYDGRLMFAIVDGDVDLANGETPEEQAKLAVDRLRQVVDEIEERRDPRALLAGAGLAVAASLLWYLLLRGILALDRRVGAWAARRAAEHAQKVKLAGVKVLDEANVLRFVRMLVRAVAWGAVLVTSFLWLNAVLTALPHTRPWGERLTGVLLEVLSTIGQGILDALPGLFFVVVIVVIARMVARVGAVFLDRVREENLNYGWLDRDTATPTRMVFTVLVWLFALAMAYPYLPGAQSQAFQGVTVLAGLMFSIGASGTVGQAASGIILMYTRSFRVGEYVRIGETEGTVAEIGLFVTRVRTGLGEEVMLPNSVVLGTVAKNFSRVVPGGRGFVLDTTVTIGYDTPWRQVEAMLLEAARRTKDVLADPPSRVVQTGLEDFYAKYRLVAYAGTEGAARRAETIGKLHANIQDVFNEYGVQIMSPHYLADPPEAKVVPKEKWFEKPAAPPPAG